MIQNISIDKLIPHPHNPRKNLGDLAELAESIKAQGVLQNLTVIQNDDDTYTVIIGHRRCAAAMIAGLTELPCAVVEMDERTQISTMLVENVNRSDLTIVEEAEGFQMMLDLGETVPTVAKKTGFSERTVRHRINLNVLDKVKLQEASMRGGRIEDYIALEKIKNEKVRNKLLESIGTNNFKWEYDRAIDEQEKPARKKALIAELSKFAKLTKNTNGLCHEKGFYGFKGEVEIPKDADKTEYYYTVDSWSITLYRKPLREAPKKKSAAEKSFNKKEAQLKDLSKQAYELRYSFVMEFSSWKKYAVEIRAFAFKRLLHYGSADLEKLMELFEIKPPEGDKYGSETYKKKRNLIFEKYRENPEKVTLLAAYVTFDDKPSNRYYYTQEWNGFKIEHQRNDTLDAIYDSLIALGYEMSDEEKALRDGTHELFDKPKDQEAETEPEPESVGRECAPEASLAEAGETES